MVSEITKKKNFLKSIKQALEHNLFFLIPRINVSLFIIGEK